MAEYKLNKKGNILENGHTMFMEDVIVRLKRLDFLEKYKKNLVKIIDKHFWDWDTHHYECDAFLEDLDKLAKREFAISENTVKNRCKQALDRIESGDIEIEKGFWKNEYTVFTGREDNILQAVSFDCFENAQIFSEVIKLREFVKRDLHTK